MLRDLRLIAVCMLLLFLVTRVRVEAQIAPAATVASSTIFLTASGTRNSPLSPDTLTVSVDKKPAQILSVRPARSDKLLFALLIDRSTSQEPKGYAIRQVATQIFRELSSRGEPGYVGLFDVGLYMSHAPLSVSRAQEVLETMKFGGATSIYDSIAACSERLSREANPGYPRRVIILLADGDDNQSRLTIDKADDAAEREGIAIFSLDTSDRDNDGQRC